MKTRIMYNQQMNLQELEQLYYPYSEQQIEQWVEMLNKAPAGWGPEWRKLVIKRLLQVCKEEGITNE